MVQPKLSPILYELVGRISKLDVMLLWFTADTAEAMTIQLLPLFLDIKKKDGSAYLLCIVEVCFLAPCNVRLKNTFISFLHHTRW